MNIRHPKLRRSLLALYLLAGLFAQFQMVFACEAMEGKTLYVCCCDEPGAMGCAMSGKGCGDTHGMIDANCCDTSYQRLSSSLAISQDTHALQLLLLDAAQPPPALLPVTLPVVNVANAHSSGLWRHSFVVFPSRSAIYLLTQRLRI